MPTGIKEEAGKTIAPNAAPPDFLRNNRLPIGLFIYEDHE